MRTSVFGDNNEILEAKGSIPFWVIAKIVNVHENTIRNWMRTEMSHERKQLVLSAIDKVKQQKASEEK